MRYYPSDVNFYVEEINQYNKYRTCNDITDTIYRRKNNICGKDICPTFFHPEKSATAPPGGKKKKNKKKGKNDSFVRQKPFDEPQPKFIRHWNDLKGKKIDQVKDEHLYWPDWTETRLNDNYLPSDCRPTYIKLLHGESPLPYALIPINLVEVRKIIEEIKIAQKLAKKLAKEKKEAAKRAKEEAKSGAQ